MMERGFAARHQIAYRGLRPHSPRGAARPVSRHAPAIPCAQCPARRGIDRPAADEPQTRPYIPFQVHRQGEISLFQIHTPDMLAFLWIAKQGTHTMATHSSMDESASFDVSVVTAPPQPEVPIVVTSVELRDDGVVVNLTSIRAAVKVVWPCVDEGQPETLEDDLGTEYAVVSGEGGGDERVSRMSYEFRPAVPIGARSLKVATATGSVDIRLDQ